MKKNNIKTVNTLSRTTTLRERALRNLYGNIEFKAHSTIPLKHKPLSINFKMSDEIGREIEMDMNARRNMLKKFR